MRNSPAIQVVYIYISRRDPWIAFGGEGGVWFQFEQGLTLDLLPLRYSEMIHDDVHDFLATHFSGARQHQSYTHPTIYLQDVTLSRSAALGAAYSTHNTPDSSP